MWDDTDYHCPRERNPFFEGLCAGFVIGVILASVVTAYVLG